MDTLGRSPASDHTYDGFMSYSHAADGLLAPRLQAGLQRFAKPWWKRRAVRIFRDDSSLSANPNLWSSIAAALDNSGWFVVLLSPQAAASPWVNREIDYWKTHNNRSRILPVVTAGEFGWSLGNVAGDAVPEALRDVFTEEPRWIDLRFAKDDEQIDLKNPRFSAAVADIASALRGIPKDELESEDVRQHRRTVRTAWAGVAGLLVLAAVSIAATFVAIDQRNEAVRLAAVADNNAGVAEAQTRAAQAAAALAAENEATALANEARVIEQIAIVESRRRQAIALVEAADHSQLAMLLLLDAWLVAPTNQVRLEALAALGQVLTADRLLQRLPVAPGSNRAGLSPDGTTIYHSSASANVLRAIDIASMEVAWEFDDGSPGDTFDEVAVDPRGRWVSLTVEGNNSRVLIIDATSGELELVLDPGECGDFFLNKFSWDGRWLSLNAGTRDCGRTAESDWSVMYNTDDWSESERYQEGDGWYETVENFGGQLLRTHRVLRLGELGGEIFREGQLEVVSLPGGDVVVSVSTVVFAVGDHSGTRVAFLTNRVGAASVLDLTTGRTLALDGEYPDEKSIAEVGILDAAFPTPLAFSGDGSWISGISASGADRVFDAESGALELTLGYDGPTLDQSWSADGSVLLTVHDDALRLWDIFDSPQRRLAVALADDWVVLALERISRGFTPGECAAYQLEPCPTTLDEVNRRYSNQP